jgi:hypothetical protein
MERMAEEASMKAKEKEAKTSSRKAPASKRAAPRQQRMKFIWQVFDENSKAMASFPYRERDAAEARAAELAETTGKTHFVNRIRVPMKDDE